MQGETIYANRQHESRAEEQARGDQRLSEARLARAVASVAPKRILPIVSCLRKTRQWHTAGANGRDPVGNGTKSGPILLMRRTLFASCGRKKRGLWRTLRWRSPDPAAAKFLAGPEGGNESIRSGRTRMTRADEDGMRRHAGRPRSLPLFAHTFTKAKEAALYGAA